MNDINILDVSPYFSDILAGTYPLCEVSYRINNEEFDWFYLLADGIYPQYRIFARPLSSPSNRAQYLYTTTLSAVRSCVERVFGVLLKRFGIISRPGRLWLSAVMNLVLKTCVIIHNMITERRKEYYTEDIEEYLSRFFSEEETPISSCAILSPINSQNMSEHDVFLTKSIHEQEVRNRADHMRLLNALIQLHSE